MATGRLMTRLDSYVFRQLLLALIAVTGGLTALIWLVQSLRFVELVVNRGLSFGVFLKLTGLLVPSFIAIVLPITTYVVIQFTYQRLAGDRELTVMRTTGLSQYALARPALLLASLVVITCYVLNIWLVPLSFSAFREYQWEISNRMAAFLLQEGVFTPISSNLTVYVRARDPDGTLHGILVDDARDKDSHATILAARGRLVEGPAGPRALLIDGSRQELDHSTGRLSVLTFKQNDIDLTENNSNGAVRHPDMSEMSLPDLMHPQQASPGDARKLLVEAHRRLSSPLTALSYACIALFAVLAGRFTRHGGFVRPLAAVASVVVLVAVQLAVQNFSVRDNAFIPLIWLQAVLPGVVCGWLLLGPALFVAGPRPADQTA